VIDHAYSLQLNATGAAPVSWTVLVSGSNTLPTGLTLGSGGLISGTPTVASFFSFEVRAVDATGQQAQKTLSISIGSSPLAITTTSPMPDGIVSDSYGTCLGSNNGVGSRTWSIISGSLPTGLTLNASNGCFNGTVSALGTFTFTAQVTDQASPPQTDSRALTINVTLVGDQSVGNNTNQPALSFGGGSIKIAERVITGIGGTLRSVRVNSLVCAVGTTVTATIQGVTGGGAPDGNTLATGTAIDSTSSSTTLTIPLVSGVFFPAEAPFAVVFSADSSCQVRPQTGDPYPGEGFVFNGSIWQRLTDVDGRYDIPFSTQVQPTAGLGFMTASRGGHTATSLGDGTVLFTGGSQSAEVYDPSNSQATAVPNMSVSRTNHTATLLDDGTVLIVGGQNGSTYLASAEIYHPDTKMFEVVGSMAMGRSFHTATKLADGRVLITGGQIANCCTNWESNTAEFYTPAAKSFTSAGTMTATRRQHTATRLVDGRVVLAGGWGAGSPSVEIFDPTLGSFTQVTSMSTRSQHTATLLGSGQILLAGGAGSFGLPLSTADLFDPTTNTVTSAGTMGVARVTHAAALLGDGSVLMVGGQPDSSCCTPRAPQASTERYVTGSGFTGAASALVARYYHTATVLTNGKVLLSGTFGWSSSAGRTVEVYDPATAVSFGSIAPPVGHNGSAYAGFTLTPQGGTGHTITQVSGAFPAGLGYNSGPHTVTGTPTQSGTFRVGFTVTNAAGYSNSTVFTFAVDPLVMSTVSLQQPSFGIAYNAPLNATGAGPFTWSVVSGSLPGGLNLVGNAIVGTPTSANNFSFTLRVVDAAGEVVERPFSLGVSLTVDQLPNQDTNQPALIFGGGTGIKVGQQIRTGITGVLQGIYASNLVCPANTTLTADVQTTIGGAPSGISIATGTAPAPTPGQAVVLLSTQPFFAAEQLLAVVLSADAQCQLFPSAGTVDGYGGGEGYVFSGAWQRLMTYDGRHDVPLGTIVQPNAGLSMMAQGRGNHTATTLLDNRVLLAGGNGQSAEIYDPATGAFSATGSMNVQRWSHRATLLDDGTVLITGGYNFTGSNGSLVYLASAELYHPDSGTFELLPSQMTTTRNAHGATKLTGSLNGMVLITGGSGLTSGIYTDRQSAELYNPNTKTFAAIANMVSARSNHSATLLADGRVLLVGGYSGNGAELFDPITSLFTPTANAPSVSFRARHTATRLLVPLGAEQVLIAGGSGSPAATSAELFDPATNMFTIAGSLLTPRVDYTATLLGDGSVLLAGGFDDRACCPSTPPSASMERYIPGTGFRGAGSMIAGRFVHTASMLASGKVLFAGTFGWSSKGTSTGELYDPAAAVALVNVNPPVGFSGDGYPGFALTAQGGTGSGYTIAKASGNLPSGMSFNAGTISGTPGESGTFTVSFSVTDSAAHANTQTLRIFVDPVFITTTFLPNGQSGIAYNTALGATGVGPITWRRFLGSLPPGLTVNANGTITGTPTATGSYNFTVEVVDGVGQSTFRNFNIQVN
jgi:hypothetical protein